MTALNVFKFAGLQSGPTHQICQIQRTVQLLSHQALLHLKYSHYSAGIFFLFLDSLFTIIVGLLA